MGELSIRDRACIVGIGSTEFSRCSGRTELALALDAIRAALADAGLGPGDVDGMAKYTFDSVAETDIARAMGMGSLRFYDECGYGGGASCALILHAAMAIATGTAEVVVCYRAMNEASGRRYGVATAGMGVATTTDIHWGWYFPFGCISPAAWVGLQARRYMHEYGATSRQFGWVAVVCREHAARNPRAMFYNRPITIEDHQASRMIVDPLHLYDCCLDTDGAVALVVTTPERARDLRQRPVYVMAAAQSLAPDGEMMTSFYRPSLSCFPDMHQVGWELWRMARIGPRDVDAVELYDAFTPLVPMQLEDLGFVGRGEGGAFCEGGERLRAGGELPLNTSGGALSEAYIHGMNHIAEGVRQLRGKAINQVADPEIVLVTAGLGVPTSGLILRR